MSGVLIDKLRALLGDANVLTEGDLGAWEQDWRKRSRGKALAVVRPGSTQQVAEVVKACAAAGRRLMASPLRLRVCGPGPRCAAAAAHARHRP